MLPILRCKSSARTWMNAILNSPLQGQYHFVFVLAPEEYKKFAAFVVGWMNILGWSVALCSGISVVVASVSGLIEFWDPAFQVTQLQSYLLYVGVTILSGLPKLSVSPAEAHKLSSLQLVHYLLVPAPFLGSFKQVWPSPSSAYASSYALSYF